MVPSRPLPVNGVSSSGGCNPSRDGEDLLDGAPKLDLTQGFDPASDRLLLTVPEAARLLRVSRSLLYTLIASGELPSVRVGHARRIPVRLLEEWISQRLTSGFDGTEGEGR